MAEAKLVYWFEEVDSSFNDLVGKKGANLGEMIKMGMPIVPGYVVSIESYNRFMAETGVGEKIAQYAASLGKIDNVDKSEEAGRVIRGMIEETETPDYLSKEIGSFYEPCSKRQGYQTCAFPHGREDQPAAPECLTPISTLAAERTSSSTLKRYGQASIPVGLYGTARFTMFRLPVTCWVLP